MSYDLEIATHIRPSQDHVHQFLAHRLDLTAEGSLAGEAANVVVEKRTSRGVSPLFTMDGPFSVSIDDLAEPLAASVPAPRWLVEISVPEGAKAQGVRVARMMGRNLAEKCQGAVYDPQADAVVWP